MTSGWEIDVEYLNGILQSTADWGFVDPLDSLRYSRVWTLSAQNDTVVDVSVVQKNQQLYSTLLAEPANQFMAIYDQQGEHAQLTASYGNPCTFLGTPYINNCNFDAAGSMLQWLYNSTLTPPQVAVGSPLGYGVPLCAFPQNDKTIPLRDDASSKLPRCAEGAYASPLGSTPVLRAGSGTLYEFNQGLFVGGGSWTAATGMAETAFVYIPDVCLKNGTATTVCTLHSAFHGCDQTQDVIGKDFITGGGYLPWADANNFVVLFPQALSNGSNPKGCFDWWGYADTEYASNIGTQTLASKGMIDVLLGNQVTPSRALTHPHEYRAWKAATAELKATRAHAAK